MAMFDFLTQMAGGQPAQAQSAQGVPSFSPAPLVAGQNQGIGAVISAMRRRAMERLRAGRGIHPPAPPLPAPSPEEELQPQKGVLPPF